MLSLLDMAQSLQMNAVVLQVRPACDAIFPSELEPWSPYLSGTMGEGPEDGYDPLAFAVAEAHRRGLELHAWFNPYRALHPTYQGEIPDLHVSKRHPQFVREYGTYQWLDPGDAEATSHTRRVILDVVKRYDIDAVHFDDYFYPYPVNDDEGKPVPFPDDESWEAYRNATPDPQELDRDDWRRENVNNLLRVLRDDIQQTKPWVRFGVSPFGIYRPGIPEGIQGFDPYAKLYADSKLWLEEGVVDYLAPQLYWPIEQEPQSFPVLLGWWLEQNPHGRHVWPGLYTSQVSGRRRGWPADQIVRQIEVVRDQASHPGHIHFSIKAIHQNRGGLKEQLASLYGEPALPPATNWLEAPEEESLEVTARLIADGEGAKLEMSTSGDRAPWLWLVQYREGEKWTTHIAPGSESNVSLAVAATAIEEIALRPVDRLGNLGEATSPTIEAGN